jgi:formamidopyrimidine-DNA glycosylase
MPELPEVETVVRDLRPMLVGRTVMRVVTGPQSLRRPWEKAWSKAVAGAGVAAVRRRGKWIVLDLTPRPPSLRGKGEQSPSLSGEGLGRGSSLLLHLGMTGQLTVVPATADRQDHTHLVFPLDNGTELRFRDVRRFGSADWFASAGELEAYLSEKLGPEPFDISAEGFRESVRASQRCLKAILLDQAVVAGVGNIYADEACFLSRLHPGRRGVTLTDVDCDRLREAIVAVLTKAIEGRGSTIKDYVGGSGLMGTYQGEFRAYGRTGEPCVTCTRPLEMVRLAGRSSHFCAACQR